MTIHQEAWEKVKYNPYSVVSAFFFGVCIGLIIRFT